MTVRQAKQLASAESAELGDAQRIWLTIVAEAATAWRSRATSAAGLLSAAAAASLTGLVLVAPDRFDAVSRVAAIVAAAAYVVAVSLFLAAGVRPSPRVSDDVDSRSHSHRVGRSTSLFVPSGNWGADIQKYADIESRPIRRLTVAGGVAAIIAIVATGATGIMLSRPARFHGSVTIVDQKYASGVVSSCPGMHRSASKVVTLSGQIQYSGADTVRIDVSRGVCDKAARVLLLPRAALIVVR